ncbi:fungal-specific transcription factor domain-containing protein [Xylariomycetidae sp. FL2044]|nr:fungal-specific transcription factor domain-containing protein [Xylariomycetidae sp. FL2044]
MPPFTRTRTGCFTCREDGYKCDEQKPFCGRCVRLKKTCKGYGVKLKWQTLVEGPPVAKKASSKNKRRRRLSSSPSQGTSPSSQGISPPSTSSPCLSKPTLSPAIRIDPSCSVVGPDSESTQRYLLNHWSQTLSDFVSMTEGPQNPFLVHMTPMISQSKGLRAALCSMAASHLAILRNDPSLHTVAIQNQFLAVSSLRQTLQTAGPELSLATILMLQLSDRLFTTDSKVDHLAGAKAIITRGGANKLPSSGAVTFLVSLCCYHDVLASVSRGTAPLLEDSGRATGELTSFLYQLGSVLDLVRQISKMQGQNRKVYDEQGQAIEDQLTALECVSHGDSDIGHTIEAYRHAAFIYLTRVWRNLGAPHPYPMQHARSCLEHLGRVPVSSPLVSMHVWPLWTAGCESIDGEWRQFVCDRLDVMYESRRLPSLRRVREDIGEVWRIKDQQRSTTGVDNVDCIQVILRNRQREADIA